MPVITKRKISPPAANIPQSNAKVPQLTVETTAPTANVSTHNEVSSHSPCYDCEYDIPIFYNPFAPIFNLLWVALLIILAGICAFIILQVIFYSLMGLILFILPKSQKCKKCGKIYNTREFKNNKCPNCGAEIEDEIKPH